MIAKGFEKMFTGLLYASALLYFFATVLTVANVFCRYIFKTVIFGSEELASYAVLVMSFIMFAIIEARGQHLSIDLLTNRIKNDKVKQVKTVIVGVVSCGIFGVLIYYGIKVIKTAIMYSSTSPTLHIPKSILFILIVLSFIFAVLGWICIIFFNKRRPLS